MGVLGAILQGAPVHTGVEIRIFVPPETGPHDGDACVGGPL